MKQTQSRHIDILQARSAFERGENVTALLRRQLGVDRNTPEIIEVAYDIQSGSYIRKAEDNPRLMRDYCAELVSHVDPHLAGIDSVLDVGTGEMTILAGVFARLANATARVYALDISWSRLFVGRRYVQRELAGRGRSFVPFVGEIGAIPLPDKSIGVTLSNHALEPNGADIEVLMAELFRVTRDRLVLFEPCYETHSPEQQARMERLGYIRDIAGVVIRLGGELLSAERLATHMNDLNPTTCFQIRPPADVTAARRYENWQDGFSVPGTSLPLNCEGDYYLSRDTGLCFPVLSGIPVLRTGHATLATALLTAQEAPDQA